MQAHAPKNVIFSSTGEQVVDLDAEYARAAATELPRLSDSKRSDEQFAHSPCQRDVSIRDRINEDHVIEGAFHVHALQYVDVKVTRR